MLLPLAGWTQTDSLWRNLAALLLAILASMAVTGALGVAFERVIIKPVYGQHLKQILITMGGLIVAEQLTIVIWGPDMIALPKPLTLSGSFIYGDVAIARGILTAADAHGTVVRKTLFTDVFVRREGRWQAVSAQENEAPHP